MTRSKRRGLGACQPWPIAAGREISWPRFRRQVDGAFTDMHKMPDFTVNFSDPGS